MQKLSVVIPARNEEQCLPKCLSAIEQAKEYANSKNILLDLEIVVVLNRCTDSTEAIAKKAGCKTVVEDAKNLSIIRNAGVRGTSAEFVITVDADSYMSKNMLLKIVQALQNDRVVGGGVMIVPERWSLGIFLTAVALLPVALWYRISCGLFYFRRRDFDRIGGFNEQLVSVEDIDFARRLRAIGKASGRYFKTLFSAWITTSTRKFDKFGDWYFLINIRQTITLFKGKDKNCAEKIWYDFER